MRLILVFNDSLQIPHSSLGVPFFGLESASSDITSMGRLFKQTGKWSEGYGLTLSGVIFPLAKYGFNGVHLQVAVEEKKLFVEVTHGGQEVNYTGFCIEMLEHMAAMLNFT